MKKNFQFLHDQAVQIAKTYLKAESDLIAILQQIDDYRGYRELGYKSLFEYATHALGLSESVTYNFIAIARKSKEVPQLQEMIRAQEITVSNARMIAPILTPENQEKWLPVAAASSKRELEKEIAKNFPETQAQERTRYVSEKRIELKLGISEELHDMLKQAQHLVSSQSGKAASLEETLRAALELYIEKKDPHKKAERARERESLSRVKSQSSSEQALQPGPEQVSQPVPGQEKSNPRSIPAWLKHSVILRDQGQCAYQAPDGKRCSEKRWLDIHHILPLAKGGPTTLENLMLVCRGHHQVLHHMQQIPQAG